MTVRIVQYHPRARVGDGGITNSVLRLAAAFARAGVDSVIAYDSGQPQRTDGSYPSGITWCAVPHMGIGGHRLPRRLLPVLDGASALILNSAWTVHNARAARSARHLGVPYIVAARGAYDPAIRRRRRVLKTAWWWTFERAVALNATAHHVFFPAQEHMVRAFGHTGHVLIAPNGVEVPPDRRWDGGSGGYLLYVGRFDPEHKGLDLLLEAIASLPVSRRPQFRLHGPDWKGGKRVVERLLTGLDLGRWVTVGPPVFGADKWELMCRARAFVYPSRWEAFGNAPAEAAALGVPILATPYPLARHLGERAAVLVVEPRVEALAQGLRRVQEPEMAEMGGRAAELVRLEFTWDAVARSWLRQLQALESNSP